MQHHTVRGFDTDLEGLRRGIAQMGGIAEKMLGDATSALTEHDEELAQAVTAADSHLDFLQRNTEEQAIVTIARRQPLAVDLREIVSAFRIAADLERIGDLAKNISKRILAVRGGFHPQQIVTGLQHMSEMALAQLKDVLDAYAQHDAQAALDVWRRDDGIDALHNSLFRELLTYMMEDPRNITFCTHLLFCAKNIERVGDHTTNIAETVHYLATGQSIGGERPKGDRTSTIGQEIESGPASREPAR
jgi:phosphate transport system protein